jgi:ribonuclease-3
MIKERLPYMKQLSALETTIRYSFNSKDLLKEALTHRSYLNEYPSWGLPHNERLEYLGDAVLELIVSEELYKMFPSYPEGQLTVLRAALVNYQTLGQIAAAIGLNDFILMSKGEARDTGKAREVILANAIEALMGALYLDGDFKAARAFVKQFVMNRLDVILKTKSYKDAKSELQEIIQEQFKITPTYKVLEETGPAHQRTFRTGVYFGDTLIAEGVGPSKQEAEVAAAKMALKRYR